jgi:hypothetical protein
MWGRRFLHIVMINCKLPACAPSELVATGRTQCQPSCLQYVNENCEFTGVHCQGFRMNQLSHVGL